ncbi:MAG: glycosyltransferase [Bacteroidetes bacterium]|nr:glycosyltransferase [Bacteroidota bacterium]
MIPKISLITPSFNQGQFIEETILSILDQGYPNLEYIIIDGGSTDQTVEIIKKYEDRITYWVSEKDNGQAHAINKGLERTTGEIVNWINSDDYLEPGSLLKLAESYQKNPRGEVFCGYTRCYWFPSMEHSHTYRMGLKKNATKTLLNIEMNQPGTFYRTEIMKDLGGVNESLRYIFDNELWMKYLCKYGQNKVELLDFLIAHFRQHGESKSFGEGFEKFHEEQELLLKTIGNVLSIPVFLKQLTNPNNESNTTFQSLISTISINQDIFESYLIIENLVSIANNRTIEHRRKHVLNAVLVNGVKLNRKNISGLFKVLIGR